MSQLSVPVCVPCARTMRCAKNDFGVVTMTTPDEPYEVHRGDKYRCLDCGTEVVVGFGAPQRVGIDDQVDRRWIADPPLKITDN